MLKYFHADNPIHKLPTQFQKEILKAQNEDFEQNYNNAHAFITDIYSQLRLQASVAPEMKDKSAVEFSDKSFGDFF